MYEWSVWQLLVSFSEGNDIDGKREYKMMCIRGFAVDVPKAIALDDQLETSSKQPPNNSEYVKSFTGEIKQIFNGL